MVPMFLLRHKGTVSFEEKLVVAVLPVALKHLSWSSGQSNFLHTLCLSPEQGAALF